MQPRLLCALVHVSHGVDGSPVSPAVDHLGLAYLAGTLRRAGHEAVICDGMPTILDETAILERLCAVQPDMVGFALNYSNVTATYTLAGKLLQRYPSLPLFAGGYYATFHHDALLAANSPFSAVVLGEGETPLLRMAEAGPHPAGWRGIPGVAVRHGDTLTLCAAEPGPQLHNIAPRVMDALPQLAHFPHTCARVAVEFSRGCTHACRFCSIAAVQFLMRQATVRRIRSPQETAAEIARIVDATGLRFFWFMDADMLGPPAMQTSVLELARHITALRRNLSIEIDARADGITPSGIAALREAGLERCFLGAESFDAATLRHFSKGNSPETNLRAVRILEEQGVRPILGMIMFHPNSTVEQLRRDHAVLRRIGYEKTQMLFRLKKYKGSLDAGIAGDSDGKGVEPSADYGWSFTNFQIQELWEEFDALRIKALDDVFVGMTQTLHQGKITSETFMQRSDRIFHDFGKDVDRVLG